MNESHLVHMQDIRQVMEMAHVWMHMTWHAYAQSSHVSDKHTHEQMCIRMCFDDISVQKKRCGTRARCSSSPRTKKISHPSSTRCTYMLCIMMTAYVNIAKVKELITLFIYTEHAHILVYSYSKINLTEKI